MLGMLQLQICPQLFLNTIQTIHEHTFILPVCVEQLMLHQVIERPQAALPIDHDAGGASYFAYLLKTYHGSTQMSTDANSCVSWLTLQQRMQKIFGAECPVDTGFGAMLASRCLIGFCHEIEEHQDSKLQSFRSPLERSRLYARPVCVLLLSLIATTPS